MKRLLVLAALGLILVGSGAVAQVPRTVLCEIGSATW